MLLGKTVYLGGWRFQILKSDEYTEKYMQDNEEVYPEANYVAIFNKIKAGQKSFSSL